MKQCKICGGRHFAAAEYRHERDAMPVPALECADCRALLLDETVAISDEERSSIRLAKGMRSALAASAGSSLPDLDELPTTRAAICA